MRNLPGFHPLFAFMYPESKWPRGPLNEHLRSLQCDWKTETLKLAQASITQRACNEITFTRNNHSPSTVVRDRMRALELI